MLLIRTDTGDMMVWLPYRGVAQLVARVVRGDEVAGSSPASPIQVDIHLMK